MDFIGDRCKRQLHAKYIRHFKVIVRHALLRQFSVETVELFQAGCERGHHMSARAIFLLSVNVVAQSFVKHCLKLAPLVFGDLAQCG
jgi:hypothetical protein